LYQMASRYCVRSNVARPEVHLIRTLRFPGGFARVGLVVRVV
jgi:hypothetical protein